MRVLVTGATGYLGNGLAQMLAERGNDVNIVVRNKRSAMVPRHENISVFAGDITDAASIEKAASGCEGVYHTAAMVKIYTPDAPEIIKVNVDGTRNVLNAALKAGVRKVLFTSTCGVYGSTVGKSTNEDTPHLVPYASNYDLSKAMGEQLVREYSGRGLETSIVSLTKMFGPGRETHPISVNKVIRDFISGRVCVYPLPASLVSNYVFIDDAAEGHILAMNKGVDGGKYIIGGENLTYHDFFRILRQVSGIKGRVIGAPRPVALAIGFLNMLKGKVTGKEPFFTHKEAGQIYFNKSFSLQKAISQLGYRVTAFEEAARLTMQFYGLQ